MDSTDRHQRVRADLLAWYRANRRDLPWRRTRDPYAVWISEVMLQQTRVDTVRPYFERFLERWPTVKDLAAADPDDVRAAWSGLGYYRRARLMLEAAAVVADDLEGRFPEDPAELRALPGFGRYTAGAVASIAFDRPAAAVDGNVSRVLARLEAIEGDVTKGAGARQVWAHAESLAPGEGPGDWTQALIELGALVCSSKRPRCEACPIATACRARAADRVDEIPPPRQRAERKTVELTALIAVADDAVLLSKQPEQGLFASLWCPPFLEGHLEPDAAADEAERALGLSLQRVHPIGRITHVLTHRDLQIDVVRVHPMGDVGRLAWAKLGELESWAIPSVTAKCLKAGLEPAERARAKMRGRTTRRAQAAGSGQADLFSREP